MHQKNRRSIRLGVLLLLMNFPMALIAHAESIMTLGDSISLRKVSRAVMSPNGEHIAYTLSYPRAPEKESAGSNGLELYVVNKEGLSKPFVTDGAVVISPKWGKDSYLIWFISKQRNDRFTSLYAIPVGGGQSQRTLHLDKDILGFDLSSNNKHLLFWTKTQESVNKKSLRRRGFVAEVFEETTPKNQLWVLDLTQKSSQPKRIYDTEHVVHAQFIPTKDEILIQSAPSANVDDIVTQKSLQRLDLAGNTLIRYQHVGKMGKATPSPNGEYIAFIGSNDIHAPAEGRLMLAKANSSRVSMHLTKFKGEVKDIVWLSKTTVGFIAHIGTEAIFASKKANLASASYKKIISNKGILTRVTADKKGKNLAFVNHDQKHPAEVYWFSNRKFLRASNSNPWLADKRLANQKSMTFKARDGQTIQGIYVKPLTPKPSGGYPLLLFVHGGPESHVSNGWLDRYSSPVHYAAAKGYASFFPNYRGSTGRGSAFTRLGQKDYAGAEFDDLLDAVSHLKDEELINLNKVGISGASYGGYASAWGATALSEHFSAAVMLAGISDQISKFGTTDIPSEMVQGHSFIWPWQGWQWMLERSPIFHVKKHTTPLLIAHGLKDTRVDPSQSKILYRYLKELKQAPVRLIQYPDEEHGLARAATQLDYSQRLMRWMDYYLVQERQDLPPTELDYFGVDTAVTP